MRRYEDTLALYFEGIDVIFRRFTNARTKHAQDLGTTDPIVLTKKTTPPASVLDAVIE